MPPLVLALALALQTDPARPTATAPEAIPTTAPPSAPVTSGDPGQATGAVQAGAAPTEPFAFVAWCAGATDGYLRLKPEIFSEVTRIETQFRRPGSSLSEDLQDYADMEKDARRQMLVFQRAIQTAEKASPSDLSARGLASYKRGLAVWAAPSTATKARIAQEWMSWVLPARCETTAKALTTKASLMGEALGASGGVTAETAADPAENASAQQPAAVPTTDSAVAAAPAQTEAAAPSATKPAAKKAVKPRAKPVAKRKG